jgi:DNA-binding NtrC family response regulator
MSSKILLVMPQGRRDRLLRFLPEAGIDVVAVDSAKEARKLLAEQGKYDLAFVDSELPDGSWRDVLEFIVASKTGCEMVVCSRCGDERLWAEVIQCGAFDLVPEPLEQQEILRIIRSALDCHYMQRFGHASEARAC